MPVQRITSSSAAVTYIIVVYLVVAKYLQISLLHTVLVLAITDISQTSIRTACHHNACKEQLCALVNLKAARNITLSTHQCTYAVQGYDLLSTYGM